jgi:hypothetical protein
VTARAPRALTGDAVADAALDALAEALLPRLIAKLKERACTDDVLADVLRGTGFELDTGDETGRAA